MEESKRGDCNGFQSLAPEIKSDILSRLPIEWILNCKCVCKTWYALINDNYFVKLHLSIGKGEPSSRVLFEPLKGMIKHEANKLSSKLAVKRMIQHKVSKLYLLDVKDCKVREIPGYQLAGIMNKYDTHKYDTHMTIMCSLDGLICVGPTKDLDPVIIYNPLIRGDYVILPKSNLGYLYLYSKLNHVTLGFDPSISKYKAVRILTYSVNSFRRSLCEVITIGEKSSWRQVVAPYAGLIHEFYGGRGGVFHQGSIYWIIDKFNVYNGEPSNSNNREYILEFDVTKEVFGVVSFPPSVKAPKYRQYNDPRRFNMQLQVLGGGSLALMEYDGQLLHIWRLVKDNGNHVVGYRSIRIESPYKDATIIALLCPNGTEDFMLLRTDGGYEPGRSRKGEKIKTEGSQFSYHYPFSKKNDRFVHLSCLPVKCLYFYPNFFYPWCFKPSFISIKAASLSHL